MLIFLLEKKSFMFIIVYDYVIVLGFSEFCDFINKRRRKQCIMF